MLLHYKPEVCTDLNLIKKSLLHKIRANLKLVLKKKQNICLRMLYFCPNARKEIYILREIIIV